MLWTFADTLDLILVDPPYQAAKSLLDRALTPRLCMYAPYSQYYRGMAIPQLYEQNQFSPFDCVNAFLAYHGNLNMLFVEEQRTVDCVTLAYSLSSSLWLTNVRHLSKQVQTIAFKGVERPSMALNNVLHKHRHDLVFLRAEVQKLRRWIFPGLKKRYDTIGEEWPLNPTGRFDLTLTEAAELERFLMDTFQLVMSSISVLDSQTSIQNATRSTHLTQLATVYLPLSFVTGIFGMNLREINGAQLPIWVSLVTLAGVAICTAGLLWLTRKSRLPLDRAREMPTGLGMRTELERQS